MSHLILDVTTWLFGPTIADAAQKGAILTALFLTALALNPLISFFRRGWAIKREDIFSSFGTAAKANYLTGFLKRKVGDDADAAFAAFYTKRYGRKRFIVPIALFALVCFTLMLLIAQTTVASLAVVIAGTEKSVAAFTGETWFLVNVNPVAAAGIFGGYLWVTAGFVTAARRYDVHSSDVLNGALRLSVSAAIGYALSTIAEPHLAAFVAFAAGAFPLSAVNVLLRRLASSKMGLQVDVADQTNTITKLDGIDPLTADRLYEAGITTVPQLAYCDPVQLCMRTGLAFDFVADAAAQALAWDYIGDEILKKLKPCGLRTSVEFRNLGDRVAAGEAEALKTRDAAAALVGLAPELFDNLCREIAGDPYTEFLCDLWNWRMPVADAPKGAGQANKRRGKAKAAAAPAVAEAE
jgi:hypothetical protein